ncbi:hypothetical protein C8R47DRAFT_1225353 [Mycena vitilis]|nr:hypothetical protein C8R47DRAFT_1225353 [Mycena vitilis]
MSPPPFPTDTAPLGCPYDRCEEPRCHQPLPSGAQPAPDHAAAAPSAHAAPDVVLNVIAHPATCTCTARLSLPADGTGERVERAWPSRDSERVCQNSLLITPIAASTRQIGAGRRQSIEDAGCFPWQADQRSAAKALFEPAASPAVRPPLVLAPPPPTSSS